MTGVRLPSVAGILSPRHCIQIGSGAHPTSSPVGTWGYFPGERNKASGTWSWSLTSI